MKVALLLLLFCLAQAEEQHADTDSRLSAIEAKMEEFQTRLNESEKVQDQKTDQLQTSFDQLQASFDQFQDRLNLLTREPDCMKRKLCEQDGFQFKKGLCYYISTVERTWEAARDWCRDKQSDLIVIQSKEKQEFVASFNKKVWLGLTDTETEGSFQWVDGTPLTEPRYWMAGEPDLEDRDNPNSGEDCVEYYDGSEEIPSKGWNDAWCSFDRYWICERVVQ